ncbi:MAG: CHAT domain-containing protein [Mesorhizobium sp.]|nr:MAG: CHAT domain-containing protein [Mesorhizobium sp.]
MDGSDWRPGDPAPPPVRNPNLYPNYADDVDEPPAWPDAVGPCGRKMLIAAIAGSTTWDEVLKIKKETGFALEEVEIARIEMGYREEYLKRFDASLIFANGTRLTYMLAFGNSETANRRCTWLLGPDGVIASQESTTFDASLLEGLRIGLGVKTRASTRLPLPRRGNEDCDFPEESEADSRTPEQLGGARDALKYVADAMIPGLVATELEKLSLTTVARLLVLPDSDIASYPFAALPFQKGHLVDRFDIIILPSIKVMLTPRTTTKLPTKLKEQEALIVGEPDLSADKAACWRELPHAKIEAGYAAQQFGIKKSLLGKTATFKQVRDRLRANRKTLKLIYFATHGIADQENPADESYLALRGQYLRGADLRKLQFGGSPLVVLSACQSGLGKVFPGGLFGLAQAWRYAGADRVVISLWNVSDMGTEALMKIFVDGLTAADLEPEVALSRAMRTLKQSQPDPAIWAAFAYYGTPAN